MFINLSPIKYRRILQDKTISTVKLFKKEIVYGSMGYAAHAYLNNNFIPDWIPRYSLYGSCHGSGSSKYKNIAYYKAISEALERWAFLDTCSSSNSKLYGFDIDSSTSGMSALPAFSNKHVSLISFYEAVERWALREWWGELLKGKYFNYKTNHAIKSLEIITPFKNTSAVILWKKVTTNNLYTYGFACNKNLLLASKKAEIELKRNEEVLSTLEPNPDINTLTNDYDEKRLVFFSTSEGHRLFLNKVKASVNEININYTVPKKIIDCEIIGPWSKYTTVWRILFEAKTYFNYKDLNFFNF